MDDRYEVLMRTIEAGDFDKALTLLETGIRRGVPVALYLAGTVWLKRGNLEKAKDYLEEASSYGNEDAEELLEDSRFSTDLYQSTEPGEDTHNLSEPIEKQQDTDATSKKQFQDLQMKAESYRNTLIEARLEKEKRGPLKLIAFSVVAVIPAYLIGGQLGGAAFLGIMVLLYYVTDGF